MYSKNAAILVSYYTKNYYANKNFFFGSNFLTFVELENILKSKKSNFNLVQTNFQICAVLSCNKSAQKIDFIKKLSYWFKTTINSKNSFMEG